MGKTKEAVTFNVSNKNGLFKPTLEMKRRPSTGIPLKKNRNILKSEKSYSKKEKEIPS